ncbi:hypothetical protein [Maledivibacter halophilus]|uniref:Uncharacterized protein n=1 Tax=Maledivibacter halophilus TaxID=36842 RepID=A0A1T5M9V5_9FIRM|nr:hypothetical protein [Maledivibacter halophilus]SKC84774.1 hypothetical protein SAMN02194393_04211 [Maledivibacter halophilus]
MDGSYFLFSFAETDDGAVVFITSKDTWENQGTMDQGFKNEEMKVLEPILEKAGLYELMGSCYEMTKSPEETRDTLLENGLLEDSNFDKLVMTLYT